MGVGAEIAQHMFRAAEGLLGIDNPVVAEQYPQPGGEGARMVVVAKLRRCNSSSMS